MKKMLCMLLALLMLMGLSACGQSAPANDAAPAEETAEEIPDVTYSVSVADSDGNPIPGVTVQFCDDVSCTTGDTDDSGTAEFTAKEGIYTVHVLKVPEGFIGTDEEFSFPDGATELGVALDILVPTVNRPQIGFAFYNPKSFEDSKGLIDWVSEQIGSSIFNIYPLYYYPDPASDSYRAVKLFDLLFVQKDESAAEDYLKEEIHPRDGWDIVTLEKVGSAEDLTCFLLEWNQTEEEKEQAAEDLKAAMGEYYDEYAALSGDKETFLSGFRFNKPEPATMLFETQDLDGSPVNMADVLAGHKVTMVNLWATWCGPCVNELPDLGRLSKTFEEKDCQIIGICLDVNAGGDAAEAKSILENAGAEYLNLAAPENRYQYLLLDISTYPTTYFVDSEGNVLTEPVVGAMPSRYPTMLNEALAKLG